MTPATMGKHFDDLPALAPFRKRLGELASRNIVEREEFVNTGVGLLDLKLQCVAGIAPRHWPRAPNGMLACKWCKLMCLRLTDRRSAAGRALDHFSNQMDRERPPGPLERLVIPPLVRARIYSPLSRKPQARDPAGLGPP